MVTKLVIENLKHRPIRTLLTVIAIGLQVTLVLTIVGLSRGMIDASTARSRGVGADIIIRPPGSSVLTLSSAPMREAMIGFVEKQPHVTMAQGVVIHSVGGPFDSLTGIDIERFNRMSGGFDYRSGGSFQNADDVLIDTAYAAQRKLKVGDTVELANHKWTIRGIVGTGKLGKLFVQKKVLQEITANTDKLSVIYAKVDQPQNVSAVVASLKKQLEGYPIYEMEEFLSSFTPDSIPGLSPFITVLVSLSVVFGFLVVFLAMYTAVLERTREIGILKALGATAPFVVGMLVRETVFLAAIGSVLGIGLAWVTKWIIISLVPSSLPVMIVPEWWWRAALISLAGSILGALYPGLKAARQDTVEALTYE